MIDLFFLSKLKREPVSEDGKLIKYPQLAPKEPMPKHCRIYFGLRQYDPKGILKTILHKIIYKPNEHCEGLRIAMATMGKDERAWFKVPLSYSRGDRHLNLCEDHCMFVEITIEDVRLKMTDQMELSDRKELYKQTKEEADDAFQANNYVEAAKSYQSCINCVNALPRKMERTVEEEKNLLDLIRTCQRNFVICVVKGRLTVEEDKARILINKLVEVDPSAKNYYLQGKLMMQMKYLSNAKQALQKSHELEPNEKTMSLLKSIREGKSEKEVCKYIINNLEAERIRESQQRKREAKDDWFNAAEREEEKKLIVQNFLLKDTDQEIDNAILSKLCMTDI